MPHANASARKSGTIGSTVNERRIASLNFVRGSLPPVLPRNPSSREVTKLAVPDAGSRRQSSASRREAGSKAPAAISASTSARRGDGRRAPARPGARPGGGGRGVGKKKKKKRKFGC